MFGFRKHSSFRRRRGFCCLIATRLADAGGRIVTYFGVLNTLLGLTRLNNCSELRSCGRWRESGCSPNGSGTGLAALGVGLAALRVDLAALGVDLAASACRAWLFFLRLCSLAWV